MDYVYICENNTIYGTKYKKLSNTKGKNLVADVSSCFLSELSLIHILQDNRHHATAGRDYRGYHTGRHSTDG